MKIYKYIFNSKSRKLRGEVEIIESIRSYPLSITAYKSVGRDCETSIDTVNCFKPLSFRRIISSFKRLSESEKERIVEIMKRV